MNTPTQQATLYRKAAETIEMCAKHGIEPIVKHREIGALLSHCNIRDPFDYYEFPLCVLEGHLVWADTIVYNSLGRAITAKHMKAGMDYWMAEPKQPLCEVEGKPVYKGDKLWYNGKEYCIDNESFKHTFSADWSWNPPAPKRTVMVELTIEDAEFFKENYYKSSGTYGRVSEASRKALDNLK